VSAPGPAVDVEALAAGVQAGERGALGRAITLVESRRQDHRLAAEALLERLAPGDAVRIAVTGVPGAGKSTLIEALGCRLVDAGHRLAVLAIDPSSSRSRGSILGDKTLMETLARSERAFIRPSPSGGTAGGVASSTREAIRLCEAAGYDVVMVETVGVGQSEILVAGMVDFVLLLVLAGAGDELQGIKRGILELVHLVAIHKADGENLPAAERARTQLSGALRYMHPAGEGWQPPVVLASARAGTGLDAIWQVVEQHQRQGERDGSLARTRQRQRIDWLWSLVDDGLRRAFSSHQAVAAELAAAEEAVCSGHATPAAVARRLLACFLG